MFFTCKVQCLQTFNTSTILGHQSLSFCYVSDTYLIGYLRYKDKHGKNILICCGCVFFLQTSHLVVNMVVVGLVLDQSLMVIPTECYPLMSRGIFPLECIVMFVVVYTLSNCLHTF